MIGCQSLQLRLSLSCEVTRYSSQWLSSRASRNRDRVPQAVPFALRCRQISTHVYGLAYGRAAGAPFLSQGRDHICWHPPRLCSCSKRRSRAERTKEERVMIRRILVAVWFAACALCARGDERFTIERIEIRDAQRIAPQVLTAETLLREGSEVSEEDVRAGLRRLARLNFVLTA